MHVSVETVANQATGQALTAVAAAHAALDQINAVLPTDGIPHTRQFFTIARACSYLDLDPAELRGAMKEAGVSFAEARDEIAYLDGDGFLTLVRFIRARRAQTN